MFGLNKGKAFLLEDLIKDKIALIIGNRAIAGLVFCSYHLVSDRANGATSDLQLIF